MTGTKLRMVPLPMCVVRTSDSVQKSLLGLDKRDSSLTSCLNGPFFLPERNIPYQTKLSTLSSFVDKNW